MVVVHSRQSVRLNEENKHSEREANNCHEDQPSEEMLVKHCEPKHKQRLFDEDPEGKVPGPERLHPIEYEQRVIFLFEFVFLFAEVDLVKEKQRSQDESNNSQEAQENGELIEGVAQVNVYYLKVHK